MKVYNVEQLQVLIEGVDEMTPEKLEDVVAYFPYKDMVNIKSYDDQLVRKYAEFLTKLANTPYFIQKYSNVRNTLNFLWKKLCDVQDIDAEDVITSLLILYYTILNKLNGDLRILELVVGSRSITLQAVFSVLQSPLLNRNHCTILTNIVYILISADQKLLYDSFMIIEKMFHQFYAISNSYELAVVCTLVVREFYYVDDLFHICGNWILSQGLKLLQETNVCEKTVGNILEGIAIIILSTNLNYPNDFFQKMQQLLPNLFRFILRNDGLRDISMVVISIIVSNYLGAEIGEVYELLNGLPLDVGSWPNHSNLKIFFIICELLYRNDDQFLWSTESIIKAISTFVYSSYKFSLETVVLKSLCYIYPLLKLPNPSKVQILIGDCLLMLVEKAFHHCITNICSLLEDQLSWILSRGSMRLRKAFVCYWLKCNKVDELAQVLWNHRSVKLLKELILDPYLDQEVSEKLNVLISKSQVISQSTKFLQNLILYIPVKYNNEVILSRLLRIGCNIPDDMALMFKLCQFLLRALLIVDEANIKISLSYVAEMMNSLRVHDNFIEFYYLTGIWKFLACVNANNSGFSTEIIRIFKVMTLIQISKKLSLNESVEIDLVSSFQANNDKTELSLELLNHILRSDGTLFVKLLDATLPNIFFTLFDLYAEYGKKSLVCLTMIMKKKPQLSWSMMTLLFMECHALGGIDDEICPEMVRFWKCWMKSVKYAPKHKLRHRVNLWILKNFMEQDIKVLAMDTIKWLVNTQALDV